MYSFGSTASETLLTYGLVMHLGMLLCLFYFKSWCIQGPFIIIVLYFCIYDLSYGGCMIYMFYLLRVLSEHELTHKGALSIGLLVWHLVGNPHRYSWRLHIRQGWLAFIKSTNMACENNMWRRHKHFQGILMDGSVCYLWPVMHCFPVI